MPIIQLDGSRWKRPEDFYQALLPRLRAPRWHGHNLDAINDSVFGGGINGVEPPFRIVVIGTSHMSDPSRAFLRKVAELFRDGRLETGREAYIEFDPLL